VYWSISAPEDRLVVIYTAYQLASTLFEVHLKIVNFVDAPQ